MSAAGETTFAATLVTASAVWSGGASSTGTPFDNIAEAKLKVYKQIGLPADSLLLSYEAYLNLCTNAQIRTAARNIWGYGGEKADQAADIEIPTKALAQLFGLKQVIVAGGIYNQKPEGVTATRAFIWPATYAFVFRSSGGQQDANEVALGRMFVYELATEIPDLVTMESMDMLKSMFLEQYPEPQTNCTVLRAREHIDMQIYQANAGSLIKSI